MSEEDQLRDSPAPVMIPVTAEDARRERYRRNAKIGAAAVGAVLVVFFIYRWSVDPINAKAAMDQGVRQFNSGRYQEAILSFSRAISLHSSFEAYERRGKTLLAIGELDRAVQDFNSALKINPSDAASLTERALANIGRKEYKAAIEDCTRAVGINPQMSRAYNLRGMARRESGDVKGGLADLEQAVRLDQNVDNLFQRGATYQLLGEHEKAIADFTAVMEREPDNAHPIFSRAHSRLALGDTKGAREDMDIARKLDGR